MPLHLSVPPVLAADEKAPISARAHMRSDKMSPAEIQDTLKHILDSLTSITRSLRVERFIEDDEVIIYGPTGDVAVKLTNVGLEVGGLRVVGSRQVGPASLTGFPIVGTADLTYDATERDMLNTMAAAVNQLGTAVGVITTALLNHGLTS